ncbi:MAG: acetoin utilization protein AcuC [Alphaproteobacteria bacterium 41-28]|nr:MAG: acetoin utilization protein AcuC [Alphaproteobacteria bacterium 41-28]
MVGALTAVYLDPQLAEYGFGEDHPFNNFRYGAFAEAFQHLLLDKRVTIMKGCLATDAEITQFHTQEYLNFIKKKSAEGSGFLDYGDTPVVPGIFEASAYVVGTVLDAVDQMMEGTIKRAFVPIAGLHHSHTAAASGFCVFNDIAIAIHTLRQKYNVEKIAYVDIDVHHGDGVYYAFENDGDLVFADIHQSGIFPGTGHPYEQGKGQAKGKKLNIPLPAGAGDEDFFAVWPHVEKLLEQEKPEFIILQCGADSLADDPLAYLQYSEKPHAYATRRLCELANKYAQGRLLALGGGGYNLQNIARAWTAVVRSLIDMPFDK